MITILFPKTDNWKSKPAGWQKWAERNIRGVKIYRQDCRIVCNFLTDKTKPKPKNKLGGYPWAVLNKQPLWRLPGSPVIGKGKRTKFRIYFGTLHGENLSGCVGSISKTSFSLYKNGQKLFELQEKI